MHPIVATGPHARALRAIADLLTRLKLANAYVGSVARAAWLGGEVAAGSIDVVAVMGPQQKNQIAMMANNRGWRVDRDEIEQSEELDLIPLNFVDDDGEVRVHVLVASNALYGRMVAAAREATFEELTIKVPAAEDFAMLLALAGDDAALRSLTADTAFDRRGYNEKLISIGLPGLVVAE
jgi:hypothetical protein